MKPLPFSETCFVCGANNHCGLGARFHAVDDAVVSEWRPRKEHCGYSNVVHGGIVAALLDEAMAWASTRFFRRMCVTGELTVRYLSPVDGDKLYVVRAHVVEPGRRRVLSAATLLDGDGKEYADARGKFVPLSAEATLAVDDALIYQGDEERLFDELRARRDGSA